jgi:hypothetical protein
VLVGFTLAAGPVAAAADTGLNRTVTGPFTGTSVFDFSTPACSFAHQVYDASYNPQAGSSGSFHLDGCVTFGPGGAFDFNGTFALQWNHATLAGTVAGVVGNAPASACPSGFASSLAFTLTVQSGTGRFNAASGTISLDGTWCSPTTPNVAGPINGDLTGHLSH